MNYEDPRTQVVDFRILKEMNDAEAIEFARAIVAKFLILHKFEDKNFYGEFLRAVGALINTELLWQEKHENDKALMSYFFPEVN